VSRGLIQYPSLAETLVYGGRGLGIGPAGDAVVALDLFDTGVGTYTRGSPGTYQTDPDSIATASNNIRRFENLGSGDMLLLEGSRLNYWLFSDASSSWTADGAGTTITYAAADGPLGASTAMQVDWSAADATVYRTLGSSPANLTTSMLSVWMRGAVGGEVVRIALRQKDGATFVYSSDITLTTSWQRYSVRLAVGSGASAPRASIYQASTGAATATFYVGPSQMEDGAYWPSAWILTAGATATRSADALSYAVGEYPSEFLTDGFEFTFAPEFANAEHVSFGLEQALCGFDVAGTRVAFSAGSAGLSVFLNGAGQVSTGNVLQWSRNQLLTIEVRPSAGQIALSGFTAGDGTYSGAVWSFPAGSMVVGNRPALARPTWGRFGRYIEALS